MALQLKIIIASTRPGRVGPTVARWVEDFAREQGKFDIELVDLAEVGLPLFDEPKHPMLQQYEHEHTKRWSKTVGEGDAFVFVTPEYDYFPPASVVNAIQYLSKEWTGKPAGIVSYGGVSAGLRASQVLRQLLSNLNVVALSQSVPIPFTANFLGEDGVFRPNEPMVQGAGLMFNELHKWAVGLKNMREAQAQA
ncbi:MULTISPECIES: NAD(P)H-dependent oxidoreductase [unclassified Devosia]|uniref:NADPH-dependent FMN reductase n=1 Tax=unclassified Devosia TaxID=196773 RepID=UPI000FDC2A92|nr:MULTISPECIES: NAD(P)H-dependent oxidoreductase [unclassified Devosia]